MILEPYQRLEKDFASWVGVNPEGMVVCSSGTAALHLALEAFQLEKGSKVFVPDFTMVACARAVVMAGLEPVFVDCGNDLLMDLSAIKIGPPDKEIPICGTHLRQEGDKLLDMFWTASKKLEKSERVGVRAIMPVHVYGRRCDMEGIASLAKFNGLKVIEDLAEAHGIKPHPKTAAACWSFYRNKIIAGEEGGAVWCRDVNVASRCRILRSLGFGPEQDYYHLPRGCSYRLSNTNATQILYSLERVEANLLMRREIEGWYDSACPAEWRMPWREVPWVYDLRIPGMNSATQDRLIRDLRQKGIPARHGFKPMSCQPEFLDPAKAKVSNAGRLASEVIYLPLTPGLVGQEFAERSFGWIKQSLKQP